MRLPKNINHLKTSLSDPLKRLLVNNGYNGHVIDWEDLYIINIVYFNAGPTKMLKNRAKRFCERGILKQYAVYKTEDGIVWCMVDISDEFKHHIQELERFFDL